MKLRLLGNEAVKWLDRESRKLNLPRKRPALASSRKLAQTLIEGGSSNAIARLICHDDLQRAS